MTTAYEPADFCDDIEYLGGFLHDTRRTLADLVHDYGLLDVGRLRVDTLGDPLAPAEALSAVGGAALGRLGAAFDTAETALDEARRSASRLALVGMSGAERAAQAEQEWVPKENRRRKLAASAKDEEERQWHSSTGSRTHSPTYQTCPTTTFHRCPTRHAQCPKRRTTITRTGHCSTDRRIRLYRPPPSWPAT